MGFRRHDLQEAMFVPGTWPFRIWGYGTDDPLADVLRADYFRAAGAMLRPGELIYVTSRPRQPTPPGPARAQPAPRVALVMVRGGGPTAVRLVQDFGGPDDDNAIPMTPPTPRKRGRPPGSKVIRKQG